MAISHRARSGSLAFALSLTQPRPAPVCHGLPYELLENIFIYALSSPASDSLRKTCLTLSLVCSWTRVLAQPILLSTVLLDSTVPEEACRRVCSVLSRHVRTKYPRITRSPHGADTGVVNLWIDFHYISDRRTRYKLNAAARRLAYSCPNLKRIAVPVESVPAFVTKPASRFASFRCDNAGSSPESSKDKESALGLDLTITPDDGNHSFAVRELPEGSIGHHITHLRLACRNFDRFLSLCAILEAYTGVTHLAIDANFRPGLIGFAWRDQERRPERLQKLVIIVPEGTSVDDIRDYIRRVTCEKEIWPNIYIHESKQQGRAWARKASWETEARDNRNIWEDAWKARDRLHDPQKDPHNPDN
jgi:hypothetical protein